MKRLLTTLLLGVVAVISFAQGVPTEGEVRKIDKDAKRITLKHSEIRNIDVPAMTMAFQVKDPAWLDRVKVGDKVRFTADKVGGAYTITSIEPR